MTDDGRGSKSDRCAPASLQPPPSPLAKGTDAASRGTTGTSCCKRGVPIFDGMNPLYKLALWIVIIISTLMFLTETLVGQLAGSQALKADALDFLADTVTYGLSLSVIGAKRRTRTLAALVKGLSLGIMGAWILASTIYQTLERGVPSAELMGSIGALALAANVTTVLMLMHYKDGDANVRWVWLCSRNDAIGNIVVMLAAVAVWGTGTAWPDLAVAALMAGIFLTSSMQILRHAWSEYRNARHQPFSKGDG